MWWQDAADTGREEQRMFAEIARLESSDSELSLKLLQIRDEMAAMAAGDNSAEIAALHSRMEADNAQMDALEQTIRDQTALSRSLQAAAESMQGRLLAADLQDAGAAQAARVPVRHGGEVPRIVVTPRHRDVATNLGS